MACGGRGILALFGAIAIAGICACGDSASNGGDGGYDGSQDGNNGVDNGGGSTVELNAATGIFLVQYPITNFTFKEGPVSGWFSLKKDGDDLAGATVKINGTLIPEAQGQFQSPGTYDPAYVSNIPVQPGGTMTITVDEGGRHHEFAFVCPAEVTITEPAENTEVSADDRITVRWTGSIKYQNSILDPILNLFEYDPATGTNISLLGFEPYHLTGTETSYDLTLPDTMRPQYFVELSVPGELTLTDDVAGFCGLKRRAHLIKQ